MVSKCNASREMFACRFDALRPNAPFKVKVSGDQEVLVVKLHDGTVRAIGNRCPHKAASLCKGDIEDLGELRGGLCVKCPKHQRKFGGGPLYVSLESGRCHTEAWVHGSKGEKIREQWHVPTFTTRLESGDVYVQVCSTDGSSSSSEDSASDVQPVRRVDKRSLVATSKAKSSAGMASANWCAGVLVKKVQRNDSIGDTFDFHFRLEAYGASRFAHAVRDSAIAKEPWHVWLRLGAVEREYTPVSSLEDAARGFIVMLIKLYEDGDMSQELARLELGGAVAIGPPEVTLPPQWPSRDLSAAPWRSIAEGKLKLGLLCAGTGVTPCFQALALAVAALAASRRPCEAGTVVGLLCSSRCGPDGGTALMSEELHRLACRAPPGTVAVRHTLTDDPQAAGLGSAQSPKQRRIQPEMLSRASSSQQRAGDAGHFAARQLFRGRVSSEMISESLPSPAAPGSSSPCAVVICGPRGFAEHCNPLLRGLGYICDLLLVLDA